MGGREREGNKRRVEAGIMRRMILWDTACYLFCSVMCFNAVISNQSIFSCLITGASTLHYNVLIRLFWATSVGTEFA